MTLLEYLAQNPRSSVQQIAEGLGKSRTLISGSISNNINNGAIIRETDGNGVAVYSVNDRPFGCGNSLTMMFNRLLQGVRQQRLAAGKITALPVERDREGYWTHPLYDEFCDGRELIPPDEFNAWLDKNGLECKVVYRDKEDIDPEVDGYDISSWHPEAPEGEGWFVGAIHGAEDGAVCIWLRQEMGDKACLIADELWDACRAAISEEETPCTK